MNVCSADRLGTSEHSVSSSFSTGSRGSPALVDVSVRNSALREEESGRTGPARCSRGKVSLHFDRGRSLLPIEARRRGRLARIPRSACSTSLRVYVCTRGVRTRAPRVPTYSTHVGSKLIWINRSWIFCAERERAVRRDVELGDEAQQRQQHRRPQRRGKLSLLCARMRRSGEVGWRRWEGGRGWVDKNRDQRIMPSGEEHRLRRLVRATLVPRRRGGALCYVYTG